MLKSVAGQILQTTQSCFDIRLFSAETVFSQACMEIVLTVFLSCYSLLRFIFCRFLFIFIALQGVQGPLYLHCLILSLGVWFDTKNRSPEYTWEENCKNELFKIIICESKNSGAIIEIPVRNIFMK